MSRSTLALLALLAAALVGGFLLFGSSRGRADGLGGERGGTHELGGAATRDLEAERGALPRGELVELEGDAEPDGGRTPATEARPFVHGRLLTRGGKPVPGFEVQVTTDTAVLAETESAADGSFRLPVSGPEACWVEVVLQPDWICAQQRQALDASAVDARPPLVFELDHLRREPLRARLFDADTGEPVPHFMLRLQDSGGSQGIAISDAEGRVVSEDEFVEGNMFLVPIDHGSYAELTDFGFLISHLAAGPESEQRLSVRVGPTYVLGLSGVPPALPLSQLSAHLRSGGNGPGAGRSSRPAAIRGAAQPWTRFRPLAEPLAGPPFRLEVRSRDGVWAGSAEVRSIVGIRAEPVPIELTARGKLRGRVGDAAVGDALAGTEVRLERVGAGRPNADWERLTTTTGGNGIFEFGWVQPGKYRLTVAANVHRLYTREVTVQPGEETRHDVLLELDSIAGDVAGELEGVGSILGLNSDILAGTPSEVTLELRSLTRPDRTFRTQSFPGADRTRASSFRFQGVPADDYELRVAAPDPFQWEPAALAVTPPADGLSFAFRGDIQAASLAFDVTDAATGESLREYDLEYWTGGERREDVFRGTVQRALYVVGRRPTAGGFDWILRAPGYSPARGDLSDFEDNGKSSMRLARIELRRGNWGADVVVLDEATRRPLPDAEVLFDDGRSGGHTDAAGRLEAEWPAAPGRVEVRLPGWRLVGGDVQQASEVGGALTPRLVRYELLLRAE